MVADPFDGTFEVVEIERSILRMFCVASQPELLPDEDAKLVAQLVEVIGFGDATTPESKQVDARLLGVAKLCVHSAVRIAQHTFRDPVGTADEDFFPVDVKSL